MAVVYTVKRSDPKSAADDLLRLWRDNLSVLDDVRQKFDWTYYDGPERPSEVYLLASDADGAARIVGTAAVGIRRFQMGERVGRAALLADLAVDRAHRTLLPALMLVREIRSDALASFDLIYGFPNKYAQGVFRRVGYKELGTMTRYVRVLRHTPYVARVLRLPLLPRLGGPLIDLATLGRRVPAMFKINRTCRLGWLPDVDERFDRLWEEARSDYRRIGHRGSAFLRWRFLRHPSSRFAVAALIRRDREASLAAYAIVQRDGGVAHIADLFGRTGDLGDLLDLMIGSLWRQGVASISFWFLGSGRVVRLLTERGFKKRESTRSVVFEAGASLTAEGADLADVEGWHLTEGDEDT